MLKEVVEWRSVSSDGVLQWQISTRGIVLGNQLQRATVWLPEPRRVELLFYI